MDGHGRTWWRDHQARGAKPPPCNKCGGREENFGVRKLDVGTKKSRRLCKAVSDLAELLPNGVFSFLHVDKVITEPWVFPVQGPRAPGLLKAWGGGVTFLSAYGESDWEGGPGQAPRGPLTCGAQGMMSVGDGAHSPPPSLCRGTIAPVSLFLHPSLCAQLCVLEPLLPGSHEGQRGAGGQSWGWGPPIGLLSAACPISGTGPDCHAALFSSPWLLP